MNAGLKNTFLASSALESMNKLVEVISKEILIPKLDKSLVDFLEDRDSGLEMKISQRYIYQDKHKYVELDILQLYLNKDIHSIYNIITTSF